MRLNVVYHWSNAFQALRMLAYIKASCKSTHRSLVSISRGINKAQVPLKHRISQTLSSPQYPTLLQIRPPSRICPRTRINLRDLRSCLHIRPPRLTPRALPSRLRDRNWGRRKRINMYNILARLHNRLNQARLADTFHLLVIVRLTGAKRGTNQNPQQSTPSTSPYSSPAP